MDLSWTAAIVLGGLVILRWVLLGLGLALLVRPVRDCPACFGPTFARQSPLRRIAPQFEWRFCPGCGWQGPARRIRGARRPAAGAAPAPAPPPFLSD